MKRHERILGKTPIEVSPLSTSTLPFPSVLSEVIVSEEDIPPGFGGQPRRAGGVSLDQALMVGPLDCNEQLGHFSQGPLPGPSFISNGPSFVSTWAASSLDCSEHLGHTLDSPVSPNTSFNKNSKHVDVNSGPRWSRILRSSHGNKDSLLSPAGKKRAYGEDSVQLELPNKKLRVFQDENDNSVDMAEAGSQPCQGL